jgi:cell division protein FtsW
MTSTTRPGSGPARRPTVPAAPRRPASTPPAPAGAPAAGRTPGKGRLAPDPRFGRPRPPRQGEQGKQGLQQASDQAEHHRAADAVVAVKRVFAAEGANYFLLLGVTLFLVVFGLVMVLSSSSVESYVQNNDNSFASFLRQALYALIGIPLMLVASVMPATFWARWAGWAIVIGLALQLLVFTPLGYGYGGNRNWIQLGSFSAQPSELVKVALVLWLAWILSRKKPLLDDWKHVVLPVVPVAGLAILLVLAGSDLGTAIVMLSIVFGALFYAGVKLRFLLTAGVVVGALGIAVAFTSSSRSKRIAAWWHGCTLDQYNGDCWQPLHGTWALASGGIAGVGLGNSKAKWSWLPEADNDYIFAIIGEELGLIGAIVVLVLFVVLAIAFIRIIRSSRDDFARIAVSAVMVWIIGQALINIAVVLGLLPVLGVPLPLISAGGSALIATLFAIGIALSFARNPREPFEDTTVPAARGTRRPTPASAVRNSRA